jgi:hypothetical protein
VRRGGERTAVAGRRESGLLMMDLAEACRLLGEQLDDSRNTRFFAMCERSIGRALVVEGRACGRRVNAERRTRQSKVCLCHGEGFARAILSTAGVPMDLHTTCQMSPTASRSGASPSNLGGPSSTASASARQRMARRCCRRLRRLILSQ